MARYLMAVRKMEKHFIGFTLRHIPRAENEEADQLAKAAAQSTPLPPDVFYQVLIVKAIKEEDHPTKINAIASDDWRSSIFAFLSRAFEPSNKHELERMKAQARQYSIVGFDLYRSGIAALLLKCISSQEGIELLGEIHVESCGAHRGAHEIAHRAMRQGFYWPTAPYDAKQLVQRCEQCQMFAKKTECTSKPNKFHHPNMAIAKMGS